MNDIDNDQETPIWRQDEAETSGDLKMVATPTVAVLFSGGDAPGMNAFLRFFVRLGLHEYGARVLGVKDGYSGLVRAEAQVRNGTTRLATLRKRVENKAGTAGLFDRSLDILRLDHVSVSGLASKGGIVLGAARCPEFLSANVRKQAFHLLSQLEVSVLVTVGGNGTLAGARKFAEENAIQVIGVPATIDNDIAGTEASLGFDTAVNNAMHGIEQLNDTAASHHRIIVVETMGRDCGNLAQTAALTGGAEIVVTPERGPLTEDKMRRIAQRLERSFDRGQTHAIVVVAEGVRVSPSQPYSLREQVLKAHKVSEPTSSERKPELDHGHSVLESTDSAADGRPGATLRKFLQQHFKGSGDRHFAVEVRDTALGHLQRGGSPSAADRLLAAQFADAVWMAAKNSPTKSGVATVRRGRVEIRPFDDPNPEDSNSIQQLIYRVHKSVTKWV